MHCEPVQRAGSVTLGHSCISTISPKIFSVYNQIFLQNIPKFSTFSQIFNFFPNFLKIFNFFPNFLKIFNYFPNFFKIFNFFPNFLKIFNYSPNFLKILNFFQIFSKFYWKFAQNRPQMKKRVTRHHDAPIRFINLNFNYINKDYCSLGRGEGERGGCGRYFSKLSELVDFFDFSIDKSFFLIMPRRLRHRRLKRKMTE